VNIRKCADFLGEVDLERSRICFISLKKVNLIEAKSNLMKVLLDIKDSKADFVMELLQSLSFVKAEPISASKARFLKEFKQAVDEVALAKQGKAKLKTAEQLLDEL
jgi:hypothetical protein